MDTIVLPPLSKIVHVVSLPTSGEKPPLSWTDVNRLGLVVGAACTSDKQVEPFITLYWVNAMRVKLDFPNIGAQFSVRITQGNVSNVHFAADNSDSLTVNASFPSNDVLKDIPTQDDLIEYLNEKGPTYQLDVRVRWKSGLFAPAVKGDITLSIDNIAWESGKVSGPGDVDHNLFGKVWTGEDPGWMPDPESRLPRVPHPGDSISSRLSIIRARLSNRISHGGN